MLTVEPGSAIPIDPHGQAALAQFIAEAEDDAEDDDPKRFMTAMEKAYRCGFVHAQHRARKLSTIPPEPWREGDPAWRVGHQLGRTLYHFGKVAGLVDTAALAAELVEATTAMEERARGVRAALDTVGPGVLGEQRASVIPAAPPEPAPEECLYCEGGGIVFTSKQRMKMCRDCQGTGARRAPPPAVLSDRGTCRQCQTPLNNHSGNAMRACREAFETEAQLRAEEVKLPPLTVHCGDNESACYSDHCGCDCPGCRAIRGGPWRDPASVRDYGDSRPVLVCGTCHEVKETPACRCGASVVAEDPPPCIVCGHRLRLVCGTCALEKRQPVHATAEAMATPAWAESLGGPVPGAAPAAAEDDATVADFVRYLDARLAHYPTDIFLEPAPGEHGGTVDGCSARAIRFVLGSCIRELRSGAWREHT